MVKAFVVVCALLLAVTMVYAAPSASMSDLCYTWSSVDAGELTQDLVLENTCTGNSVSWPMLNMTFGNIVDGEVVIGDEWIYVDSVLRPDLDAQAVLIFNAVGYVLTPRVMRDGVECGDCDAVFANQQLIVNVSGFSNYSLASQNDFIVRSDPAPELKEKVYQVVDLGDLRRDTEYMCLVQIHAKNPSGNFVLVQTNPERNPQMLLRSPDENLPESMGYFKTHNGIANVYFRGNELAGYQDFEYVVICSKNETNSTALFYEESITPEYSPAGRGLVARSVWLASEDNGFYVVAAVAAGFFGLLIVLMLLRRSGVLR